MQERFDEHLVNLHAHSTESDGALSIEEIATLAMRKEMYVAITDHNTAAAHRRFRDPRILPGIEVTAGEAAVDLVLVGDDADAVIAFDTECVQPHLDPHSRYLPIRRELAAVLRDANHYGLQTIVPHYAHHDGLSLLSEEEQRDILTQPVLIELNGQLSAARNQAAQELAKRTGHPLIAADDSHCAVQYGRTLTDVPLAPGEAMSASAIWKALRERPQRAKFKIRPPTAKEVMATITQVVRKVGLFTLGKMALGKLRYLRRASRRPSGIRGRADVGGVGG